MITRRIFLAAPAECSEQDVIELVEFCKNYLKNKRTFHFDFSPTETLVSKNGTTMQVRNKQAQRFDEYYIRLSEEVLNTYGRYQTDVKR